MDKKTIKLVPNSNKPFEIEMNDSEYETHALIRIVRERHCKSLNVVLTDKSDKISRSLPAKLFNQLDLVNYLKFSIEANFVSVADSFVELDVYTGSWEEMILTEVELSFSASPFYISCNNDQLEFIIGAPGESRMEVKPDSEGFSVVTTLVHGPAQVTTLQKHIAGNREGAQVIGRLYGRIKGRVNGADFHQRQEENKTKYSENFNRTLTEGFHSIEQEETKE